MNSHFVIAGCIAYPHNVPCENEQFKDISGSSVIIQTWVNTMYISGSSVIIQTWVNKSLDPL